MSDRKKRKYNDDCQIFNKKWSINYFFIEINGKAFYAKLKLFINQIERSNFSHFENCQIFKNKTKSLCLTNRLVEMLKKLQTNFAIFRFLDVKLREKSLGLFENPFNIDESDVDTSLQHELIELKTNSFYCDEFQKMIMK